MILIFYSTYTCTMDVSDVSSLSSLIKKSTGFPYRIKAGMYNGGILTVLDENTGKVLLDQFPFKEPRTVIALVITGFGDIFFWDVEQQGVYFLDIQKRKEEYVTSDLLEFVDRFLIVDYVVEEMIQNEYLILVLQQFRKLNYGECVFRKSNLEDLPINYQIINLDSYRYILYNLCTI